MLAASFLFVLSLSAVEVEIDGINYLLIDNAKQANVIYKTSNIYTGTVVIPESVEYEGVTYAVTSIMGNAFYICYGLTSVTIPNSVTSIGYGAFYGCSRLTSVTIPNSVTSIGHVAFSGCSCLTSVTIPNSVTSIGEGAFSSLNLTSIIVDGENTTYDSRDNCNAIIETSSNTLIAGCKSTIIPNSVTSIGEYAFKGCSGLTSVTIPNSVTSIGRQAFYRCSGLTSVTIGNSVTSIGDDAFSGCSGLTSVTIPNGVTSIGEGTFQGCSGLTSVTIPKSVTSIGSSAFSGCFRLTSVTIPNSVTSIGSSVFKDCSGLTSVTIGNSVTRIGDNAFYGCKGLTEVNISDFSAWCKIEFENDYANPVYFAQHLLLNGEEIKDLVIPNDVEQIGSYAFLGCPELTYVTIGKNVLSIGENAFDGMELRTVVSLNPEPPTGSGISSTYTYNHATLYVPEDSYWAYAYTKGWGEFIHMKEIAISDEALVSSKAYMIADAKGCNYTVYDAGKDELVNVEYTFALDEENEGACWTVMKDGGESYLYNIGAKKFAAMNEDGKLSLSNAPVNLDLATTEGGLSINGNARMFVLNDNVDVDVTAINGITTDGIEGADATVYNLQGMKMENSNDLPKGIYIKNGKKFVIK